AADYLETTVIGFVDAALAAQNTLLAAESLGLGGVFVGALRNRPADVAAELNLPDHTFAAFGLALGRPDPEEQAGVKPRLPQQAVLHHEQYDADLADEQIDTYDDRLAAYNHRFGLTGRWTDRVLSRLAGPQSMAGRHELRAHLEARGLPSR
ncbi:nitroreductase family protein, partial [Nocardioides sp. GCM10030258]